MTLTLKDGATTVFVFNSLPNSTIWTTRRIIREYQIDGENDQDVEDTKILQRVIRLQGLLTFQADSSEPDGIIDDGDFEEADGGLGSIWQQKAVLDYLQSIRASNANKYFTLINSSEKAWNGTTMGSHSGHKVILGPEFSIIEKAPTSLEYIIDFTESDRIIHT